MSDTGHETPGKRPIVGLVLLTPVMLALFAFGSSAFVGSAIVLRYDRFLMLNLWAFLISLVCLGAAISLLVLLTGWYRSLGAPRLLIIFLRGLVVIASLIPAWMQSLELRKFSGSRDTLAEVVFPRPPSIYMGMGWLEWGAPSAMRGFTAHQAVFRRTDADGNGLQDYWTADVAGFYALRDGDGNLLKYLGINVARADARPARDAYESELPGKPRPYAGWFFAVMEKDENGKPYRQDPDGDGKALTNMFSFGICAYCPLPEGRGKTLIVNEKGVVYWKETGGKPVDQWPGADPTALGWKVWDPHSRPGVW